MPWKKGESGNPSGRYRADGKAAKLRALLMPHSEALVSKTVKLALQGDTTALRLCLERLCPPLRAQDERVELPGFPATVSEQGAAVLQRVAAGEVSLDQGATLMQAIAAQARVVQVAELAERLEALERTFESEGEAVRDALYERLTPNERLNLTLEALARRDFAEATRLSDTCTQYTYRLPDCEYAMRTADLMGLAALATAWAWESAYRALAAQTAIHRLDDLCRGSEAKLERLLEARSACIADVKGIYAGWEQFCEHLGVGAELVLRVCGFEVTEKPWATGAGTEHVVPNLQTKEAVFASLMECWNGDRRNALAPLNTQATETARESRLDLRA